MGSGLFEFSLYYEFGANYSHLYFSTIQRGIAHIQHPSIQIFHFSYWNMDKDKRSDMSKIPTSLSLALFLSISVSLSLSVSHSLSFISYFKFELIYQRFA